MTSSASSLLRRPLVLLLLSVFFATGIAVWGRRADAQSAETKLTKARKELRALSRTSPAPSAENAAAIQADLQATQNAVESWRAELIPHSPQFVEWRKVPPPARRTEAYFDLASSIESLRQLASDYRVKLKPDERFGFSVYSHEGPEQESIAAVFDQRRVVSYLTDALIKAQPDEIYTIQRENPTRAEGRRKGNGSADATSRDFFVPDRRISLRVTDLVQTKSFRIVFSGGTNSLRKFLAELNLFNLPLVVRAIDVEPSKPAEAGSLKPTAPRTLVEPAAADTTAAVVSPVALTFAVTVEFIELITQSADTPLRNTAHSL